MPDTLLELRTPPISGPEVRRVQAALESIGYSTGGVDGIYGPGTAGAVKAFQENHDLAADGIVGPDTRRALEVASAPVSPEELAWREWFLGEGRFADHGPRERSVRKETGAPARIPKDWWERLEALVARRHDGAEQDEEIRPQPVPEPGPRPDPSQLSPHFRLEEFNCKDGTAVPRAAVPALERLCAEVLEPLRERFGACIVMSGYRHAAYNRSIGGATRSQHIYDDHPQSVAADLVFARGRASQWADAAEQHTANGGLGRYPSFIHVDNRGHRARWSG